jgi:dCTP deaminase
MVARLHGPLVRHEAPLVPSADEVSKALSLVGIAAQRSAAPSPHDLRFSANLDGPGRVAFHNTPWVSSPIVYAEKGRLAPERYWAPRRADRGGIIAQPSVLHLLASREYITIPPEVCGEMIAIEEGAGEFRAHFAGFFDSGFGLGSPSRIVMEIVPYGTPLFLHHGQAIFRFELHKNLDRPAFLYGAGPAGNSYQGQDLRLAKQFLPWPDRGR